MLDTPYTTLRNWIARGWIKPVRKGRSIYFTPKELKRFAKVDLPLSRRR